MRKYRYLAVAAASAMVLTVPAGAAFASAQSSSPVLRIDSTHGSAVKNGAKIGASLAKGQKVHFSIGGFAATCSTSSFGAKVVKNPASAGKATISVTSYKLSGCKLTTTISGVSLKGITAINVPDKGTITSKGAVTISEASSAKPLGFDAKIDFSGTPLACVFTGSKISGKGSNSGNTVTFTNQKLTLNKTLSGATYTTCEIAGTTSKFSAKFGPVRDSSVKHSPKVYF